MSIQFAILGLLNQEPMTGYDLKKVMQASSCMHWSGNNNQIYKALLELDQLGYAEGVLKQPNHGPTKKCYHITEPGRQAFRSWLKARPEATSYRTPFLVQLALSSEMSKVELIEWIEGYESDLQALYLGLKAQAKPISTACRNACVLSHIEIYHMGQIEAELNWLKDLIRDLCKVNESFEDVEQEHSTHHPIHQAFNKPVSQKEASVTMQYQVITANGAQFIALEPVVGLIDHEQQALDILGYCAGEGTNRVLIPGECLSEKFLDLRTKVAGGFLQKFVNYNIKAVVLADPAKMSGRLKEFVSETNQGSAFRVYADSEAAIAWLMGK